MNFGIVPAEFLIIDGIVAPRHSATTTTPSSKCKTRDTSLLQGQQGGRIRYARYIYYAQLLTNYRGSSISMQ